MFVVLSVGTSFAQGLQSMAGPDGDGSYDQLSDVAYGGSDDVWVVGNTGYTDGTIIPLAAHWDGAGWSIDTTPDGPLTTNSAQLWSTHEGATGTNTCPPFTKKARSGPMSARSRHASAMHTPPRVDYPRRYTGRGPRSGSARTTAADGVFDSGETHADLLQRPNSIEHISRLV